MKCKSHIRDLFGINNASVHFTDIHSEAKKIARIVFHSESLRFYNHAEPTFFGQFESFLSLYKQWLQKEDLNAEYFCIDGSAVLSAYGLRDCMDLDFLHFEYSEEELHPIGAPAVNSHNHHAIYYYDHSIDNIIFCPDNHFYYQGVKFASIDVIKRMKIKRGEAKDHRDVSLINKLFSRK